MSSWPIGVFASVDAGLGVNFEVVKELQIPTIQLHTPHQESRTPELAEAFLKKCHDAGITITCVFCGYEGESYADIATTARTVGLVPLETREARLQETREISDFTKLLGVDAIGLHIGFVPEDTSSDSYTDLVKSTQELLDYVARNGQNIHLETGQETADHLLHFIADVDRSNLYINFDPANMILYGTGEPIDALKKVAKHVRSIHCKDGTWAAEAVRGTEWGCEVALGTGDVGMKNYLQTLKDIGYTGPLTIEREIPEDPVQQKADIGSAVELLTSLRQELLGE